LLPNEKALTIWFLLVGKISKTISSMKLEVMGQDQSVKTFKYGRAFLSLD
jgi:hypothetical protein